jgi:hypothetical protein
MQATRNLELVVIDRCNCLRRQQRQRIDADYDCDRQRLAFFLSGREKRVEMTWQQQNAHSVGPADLDAIDGNVLNSRLRIARDHQTGRDIRSTVVLAVRGNRQ